MAVDCKWALPFSVDAQDPQLLAVTGHVGGAWGVRMQTLQGGAMLCAVVSKVIIVFCREENREKVMVLTIFLQKRIKYYFVHT